MTPDAAGFWLWHLGASLGLAALVAAGAPRLHRRLRLPLASRRYWLGAWMLAALPLPLALALQAWAPLPLATALPALAPFEPLPTLLAATGHGPQGVPRLPLEAIGWTLYGAGLAFGLWRATLRRARLRRVLRQAQPLAPGRLPGPTARALAHELQASGWRLLLTEAPTSPFVLRWPRRTLVLPLALLPRLDDTQWRLVLRHEAAHLAQRDPERAFALRLVGWLCWFNPWLPALARRVQLAAELCCDAAALDADAPHGTQRNMRRAYAGAYLETLRMSMAPALPCPAIAFSPHDQGSHRMRIEHIVHGDPHARKRPLRSLALASFALVAGGGFAAVQAAATATTAPTAVAFAGPIIDGRISSPFGAMRPALSPLQHNGVDLTAALGTPVRAPAAGTVRVATANYAPQPHYGTVIVLEHGAGWQTVYAHLDGLDVEAGDSVAPGQQIGRVGRTGKATGPHVHVEVHHDGIRVDPAAVIQPLVR